MSNLQRAKISASTYVTALDFNSRIIRSNVFSRCAKPLKPIGTLSVDENRQAFARLDYLRNRWNEIQPTEEVRERAERLLRIHNLRAADALQLAAALVWCEDRPRGRALIGDDGNLSEAARAEGFTIIGLS